jgi:hypothetical protein
MNFQDTTGKRRNGRKKRPRGRKTRTLNRIKERRDTKLFHTLWKHEDAVATSRRLRSVRPLTRNNPDIHPFRPRHYYSFRGHELMLVGYDLIVGREGSCGLGLVTKKFISSGTPITQYEGVAYTKLYLRRMSEKEGLDKGSHFATPHARSFVINGFALYPSPLPDPSPASSCGAPIAAYDLHGRGGGSFCNHDENPNAEFVTSPDDEGLGLFVVAKRDIRAGEFINVDYKKSFLNSVWTNI